MPVYAAKIALAVLAPALSLGAAAAWRGPGRAAQTSGPLVYPSASTEFYTAHVQPIFQANCFRCHAGLNHRGGLVLDSRAGMLKGGHDGAAIVPWHPEQSLLVKLIRHEGPPDDPMPMPPKSKLSDADIRTVEQWVRAGAAMPPDSATP